ncbi:MAG: hypothetical protein M3Q42_03955 [Pseudomonadota bacterium]|nr:hypothetical protein [Pseudomonadota bacterium]
MTALELKDRLQNRYDDPVPLVYYGANDFRAFLDRRVGEVVRLNSELVMDVMPGLPENTLLNHICNHPADIDEQLPPDVFVSGFPEFDDGYVEPADYVHSEEDDTYVFPASAADHVRCFDTLRIDFNDPGQLRFSHGGTGLVRLPLIGDFVVERRDFSGPRLEYTLRQQ